MTRVWPRRGAGPDDRGLTLVDLLVSSALLIVMLPLAGSLLHGTLVTQRDVQSVNSAATTAQLVARSVETGVRNASAIDHAPLGGGAELLVVRSLLGDADHPTWLCQGWYYAGGVMYTRRVSTAGASTPAITAPSQHDLDLWTVLAVGLTPGDDGLEDGPDTVFTPSAATRPTRIDLDVVVSAGTRKPVAIATAFSSRPQGQTGSAPCF